jgi:hypothetical protein
MAIEVSQDRSRLLPYRTLTGKIKETQAALGGREKMRGTDMDGIDLADAIEALRAEVLAAQLKSAGAKVQFPIQTLTIELKVGLTKTADGKAGFKVPFVGAEIGASAGLHQETAQTVTIVLGPPVDQQGRAVKVAQSTDEDKG